MKRPVPFFVCISLVTCGLILSAAFRNTPSAHAQNFPTIQQLFSFACGPQTNPRLQGTPGICLDGANPNTLIQASDGNFYGLTNIRGGNSLNNIGTVFKINASGQLQVIYTFAPDQNGNFPNGQSANSLVEGNDGFLYGTAFGGANGAGVVFRLSKAGVIQIIHNSCSQPNCADGPNPEHLMLAADGSFYGDTYSGGSGAIFRITPAGAFTVLHNFSVTLGQGPSSLGVVQASDGNFYGTTLGATTQFTTLFRLTPSGTFTVLHTFRYPAFPVSAPIQGSDGKLYAARNGGLFSSNLDGSGYQEFSLSVGRLEPLIQASDGNLWAGTCGGTNLPNGGIVQVSPNGALLQTIPFNGANGSCPPYAPLIQDTLGTMLGVTLDGGSVSSGLTANGVVFALHAGLSAPKPTLTLLTPSSASVGSSVIIYGNNLLGTMKVTFNTTNATFRVLNVHAILATVPLGATMGPVTVTNAGGTSTSNQIFTVH